MFLRVGRFHVNLRAPALLPLILAVLAPLAPAQVQSVVKLMASPNPVVLGQPVTFTAGVNWTAAASPTGTITLIDTVVCAGSTTPTLATLGSITLGSSTSSAPGSGVLSVNSFPCAGRNQVLATYGGDANYLPGAALPVVATVLTTFTPTSTTIVSSLNPSTVGQNVSFTALLSYGPPNSTRPSGTVTFIDTTSNTVVGTGAVQRSGTGVQFTPSASFATASFPAGTNSIVASYSGDNIYSPSTSPVLTQVVQSATVSRTATALSVSAAQIGLGQSATFTATVAASGSVPTGSLTFFDGTTPLATVSLDGSGGANFTTTGLALGSHSITASFLGGGSFALSTSAPVTVVVNSVPLAATTTTLAASANPALAGASVVLAATVSSTASGTPTGTFTFFDNSSGSPITLGSAPVLNGGSALTVTFLSGVHALSAAYSGDTAFAASTGTLNEVVNSSALAATTTAVASSANPSLFGQTITFTARVTGSGATPTGTVTFSAGPVSGTVTLDSTGSAVFTTSALPVGSSSVSAAYSGDLTGAGSTSPTLGQTVEPGATQTALTASPNPSSSGSPVTLTATVTVVAPASGRPGGTVAFVADSSTTLCAAVALASSGKAVCTTSALSVGTHSIVATYSGNADLNTSGSTASLTVNSVTTPAAIPTRTALFASPSSSVSGQSVTFTALVVAGGRNARGSTGNLLGGLAPFGLGSLVRSGTVAFSADGNVIPNCSSVAITRGVAACGAAALALGAHNVTAAYSSSGVYLASSASTHQTVLAAASADLGIQMLGSPFLLRITNAGPTAASSVVVTDALPAGTVFKSSLAFGAACTGPGSGNNGTVTCTAKSLPTSGEIWIFVNVGFTSPQGATITNTATVSAATSDPNAANNSASASLQVPAAGTIAAARPAPASPASN